MNFTKKELSIIERFIDNVCMDHQKAIGQHINNIEKHPKAKEYLEKHWDSWAEAYDTLRMISAKCSLMKEEITRAEFDRVMKVVKCK